MQQYKISTWHGEGSSLFTVISADGRTMRGTYSTRQEAERRLHKLDPGSRRHNVLCGCGWGHLNMREDEVPGYCPACDYPLGALERVQ